MMKRVLSTPILLLLTFTGFAQVISVSPVFPTQTDTVTITFDASQGNGALAGHNGDVYAHAGLITNASTSPTDWRHVQGNWGTADNKVKMTSLGNDKYEIKYHIPTFYGFPAATVVQKLAFVFRDVTGSTVGRDANGDDIFYNVYSANSGLLAAITTPASINSVAPNTSIVVNGVSSIDANLSLSDNGTQVATVNNSRQLQDTITAAGSGLHTLVLTATANGNTVYDTAYYFVKPSITVGNPPAGMNYGANYLNDSTVFLKILAPGKNEVYVIGDFNNWLPDTNHYMNRTADGSVFWLEISGLTPGQSYGYQYVLNNELTLADPYSELILDPQNDQYITADVFPNMHPYPDGKTSGFVSVITPGKQQYQWAHPTFDAPDQEKLVIYELLMRDFTTEHSYQSLIDTLGYLERLGINAIELMPNNEFEGNESWGYNPSFHMALDKYYGTPEKYKEFIDSCHSKGIAVIMDMVFNHAFGQSPFVRMYWDAGNNQPAANNPWLNQNCPHPPNCWGFDFDHTRQSVQDFMDWVNTYWINEYKIDGIRFDFTKGFTNAGDVGYDQTRINLLKRMADTLWSLDSDFYVMLEHWADNNEEKQLSDYGMMLWGNVAHAYQEAAMGYIPNSNFDWGVYKQRGWNDAHLISYYESHDEERVMYKTLTYGNSANGYDTRDLSTALDRQELVSLFTYAIPGPKLMYFHGELGYDISIDDPCRICKKPTLWNYYNDPERLDVYKMTSALLQLRNNEEAFHTDNFTYGLAGTVKYIHLNGQNLKVAVMGNFDVNQRSANPNFQQTGTWYEYFSGDSLEVTDVNASIMLDPGEYRLYLSQKIQSPYVSIEDFEVSDSPLFRVYPNPSSGQVKVHFSDKSFDEGTSMQIYNLSGQLLQSISLQQSHSILDLDLNPGVYLIETQTAEGRFSEKLIIEN